MTDLDLDEIEAEWLNACGPCDGGLPMDCVCASGDPRSVISILVAEVRSLRAENERWQRSKARVSSALAERNAERNRAVAALQRVEALAEKWRYKGEFGWGPWQEGYGPDQEGYVLDSAATELRAAIKGEDEQ